MPKQAGNRSSRRLLRQTTYGSFGTLNRVHALSCSLVVKYFGEAVLRLSARRRVPGNCPVGNGQAREPAPSQLCRPTLSFPTALPARPSAFRNATASRWHFSTCARRGSGQEASHRGAPARRSRAQWRRHTRDAYPGDENRTYLIF